ncbi:hypothetical protein BH09VER1_BH09VER1_31750 [soil metagenome]
MSAVPGVLVATAKIRPGDEEAFAKWQLHHDRVVSKFPGFVSSDVMPTGTEHGGEWTIILNFKTPAELTAWQKSPERAAVIAEAVPLFIGGDFGRAMPYDESAEQPATTVTEVILSKIKPGMEEQYRAWSMKIQLAQAGYPGYRGMYLQPPASPGGRWTTLVRYDTAEHLEKWMAAPERAELLAESKEFIENEELSRLATSFPGWVPVDPATGKGPPDWKTALLVLLGLFPTVMLELRFLSPELAKFHMNSSMATFIGNTGSVAVTSFITMPLFVRWFGWWLFPPDAGTAPVTIKGCVILALLFAVEVAVLWRLLPW